MPESTKPEGKSMTSQKGAHGGGTRFSQMTIKDAFVIQKRNQEPNIVQKISIPKKS
jgi:hypothetical protein